MNTNANESQSRRELLIQTAAMAGMAAVTAGGLGHAARAATTAATVPATRPAAGGPVKAFCIDFNWDDKGPATPGTYAHADPAEHVRWYQELGANTIQTFCVSYNGYAWYPSEVAPVTPGLKHPDFLGDMVKLGHKAGMKVMGYFTLGANPYWESRHQHLVHQKDSDYIKIPFTLEYLDYFCRSVEDTLKKTGVDGFMIDWVRPTRHRVWLDREKEMYRQLLGEPFPESGTPPADMVLAFDRAAIERAWRHITWAVRATRPVIIWTNHPIVKEEYPIWDGHRVLKEVDWILNESPDLEHLNWLASRVGRKTLIVQNLCGWKDHDANLWKRIDTKSFGLYGFAKADPVTTLPTTKLAWNTKNIDVLREAFRAIQ